MLLAPSSSFSGALRLPSAREPPPIEERLVRPETREQVVRGRRVIAMPANPPHGDRHFKLDYIIGAHVKEGYVGSTDLLTRSAESSDFATDTCVRRDGVDPRTDTRYLEELAFEVVNEQSLRDVTEQAEDLTARGVRRVVAIFVKKGEVAEWSPKAGAWQKLDPEGSFRDPTLARPLQVRELLDAAEADNAVARALLAKNNPVLAKAKAEGEQNALVKGEKKGLAEGEKKGLAEGRREAIALACELLAIDLTAERRARMSELDAAGLAALLERLRAERRWP
jgi:flagellar biosynthesis/type III secretory pathway protein FliH